jgi:hypothetical protein
VDTETGEVEEALYGLDFGATYRVSVRAYREAALDSGSLGLAASRTMMSGIAGTTSYTLPVPAIPKLTVNVGGAKVLTEDGMTIYAVNTLTPAVSVVPDIPATVTITASDGSAWDGAFDEDGRYALKAMAMNPATGDSAEIVINILANTGHPEIIIDEASLLGAGGQINIYGAVELGSDISADGLPLPTDMGYFAHGRTTNRLVTPVTFLATNASGNVTERIVEVLMADAGRLISVELRLAGGGNAIGIGQSMALELWGIFDNGSEYVLDESDASLTLVSGNSISLSGWTATGISEGESVIEATYQLDENTPLGATLTVSGTQGSYFNVTFNANSGTRTGGGALTQSVAPGGAAVAPALARSGYNFVGWDRAFDNVSSDLTVTALWTPAGGGDGDDGDGGGDGGVPTDTAKDPATQTTPAALPTPKPWASPFEDVRTGDWHYHDVAYAYLNGLMVGTNSAPMRFSPDMPLTRGMIVAILYRHAGSPDVSGLASPFGDVSGDTWYADAVKWAVAKGIVAGYGDGTFGSDDDITRQDLAVMLHRYADFAGIPLPKAREYRHFLDEADIANYAKEAIEAFFRAAVMGGYPDGGVHPKGAATRAEAAAMLHRLLGAG